MQVGPNATARKERSRKKNASVTKGPGSQGEKELLQGGRCMRKEGGDREEREMRQSLHEIMIGKKVKEPASAQ